MASHKLAANSGTDLQQRKKIQVCLLCRADTNGMVKYVDPASSSNFCKQRLNPGVILSHNLFQTQVNQQHTQDTSSGEVKCDCTQRSE